MTPPWKRWAGNWLFQPVFSLPIRPSLTVSTPANGSTDDWAYGDLGLAAYTFEIGTEFFESCSYFEDILIQENFPALLFAFKAARLPYQNPSGPETLSLNLDSDTVPSGSRLH